MGDSGDNKAERREREKEGEGKRGVNYFVISRRHREKALSFKSCSPARFPISSDAFDAFEESTDISSSSNTNEPSNRSRAGVGI